VKLPLPALPTMSAPLPEMAEPLDAVPVLPPGTKPMFSCDALPVIV
jgi:hypothetical protein